MPDTNQFPDPSIPNDQWAAGVRRLHDEAGGLLDIHILRREHMPGVIAGALLGDRRSAALANGAAVITEAIVSERGTRPLCLCCPREVDSLPGTALATILPDAPKPSATLNCALCPACASADDATLLARISLAIRAIWPNARAVVLTHLAAGHA